MFEELCVKRKKKATVSIIVYLIIAVALTVLAVLLGKPAKKIDLAKCEAEDFVVNGKVTGKQEFTIGSFAKLQDSKTKKQTALFSIFEIYDGEDNFICYLPVKLKGNKMTSATKNANLVDDLDAYKITFEDFEAQAEKIRLNGILRKMSKEEEEKYLKNFYNVVKKNWEDFDELEKAGAFPRLILDDGKNKNMFPTIFCGILAAVMVICILVQLFSEVLNPMDKKLEKGLQNKVDPRYSKENFIRFMDRTSPVDGFYLDDDFFAYMTKKDFRFTTTDQLLWAYSSTTTHKTNGVTTGHTYEIRVVTKAQEFLLTVKNEDAQKKVMAYLAEKAPYMMLGYSDELYRDFRKNRSEYTAKVDSQRAAYLSDRLYGEPVNNFGDNFTDSQV